MLRSLYAGVSGMKSNQTKMDVIGNNIANVNTTAFKSGRVDFEDMLSQTIQSANSPSQGRGGLNPEQVGIGVQVGSIDTDMSDGSLQPTGKSTDLANDGNGFFVISDGNETRYTRDGSFTLDKDGNLITANGYHVMGLVNSNIGNGAFDTTQTDTTNYASLTSGAPGALSGIKIPLEASSDTLSPASVGGFTFNFGNGTALKGYNIVTGTVSDGTAASATVNITNKTITINGDFDNTTTPGMVSAQDLETAVNNALSTNGITQTVSVSGSATSGTASGASTGAITQAVANLTSFGIGTDGSINAVYGDQTIKIGQLALANFQNAEGLTKMGDNSYTQSLNSGSPIIGAGASSGFGNIQQGFLEMSNVDLANEFTDMIITSRAYDANSKTITTSDQMLQQLLGLIQ